MDFEAVIDSRLQLRQAPFMREIGLRMQSAVVWSRSQRGEPMFDRNVLADGQAGEIDLIRGGLCMEKVDEAMRATQESLLTTKQLLEQTVNDIMVLRESIQTTLQKELSAMRESRMALTRESQDILKSLQDVRQFFLEAKYEEEMQRMERFTRMATELKQLLDEGTLSAVSDVMLKLADRVEPR